MPKTIIVKNINKSYGDTIALKNINFEVEEGELFGLIGPDGAGKTSLLRILCSLLLQDSGEAFVDNYNVINDYKQIRNIIGYMPGRFSLYQDLTVEENLNLFASIFGTSINENYDLIKDIYSQIEPFKKRQAGKLSGGMKQKLALSCALIHKPRVLILDEPTTGVDPVSRKELWQMLKKLKNEKITIIVSTPYMDEAGLCDRIALIQNGEILGIDSPAGIISNFKHKLFKITTDKIGKMLNIIKNYEYCHSAFPFGESIHFTFKNNLIDFEALQQYIKSSNLSINEISEINPNIEDCFMELMLGVANE